MEVQPDMLEAADTPQGFTDYVVRFRKAGLLMRSQVCRVRTETEAMAWAHDAVQTEVRSFQNRRTIFHIAVAQPEPEWELRLLRQVGVPVAVLTADLVVVDGLLAYVARNRDWQSP